MTAWRTSSTGFLAACLLAPSLLAAQDVQDYTCEINMICQGVSENCARAEGAAKIQVDLAREMIRFQTEDFGAALDQINYGATLSSVSASGTDPERRLYHVFMLQDARFALVVSGDGDDDGLFYANRSYSGLCEIAE